MNLTSRQIEYLARTIVNRLEDRGLVEFGDAELGIDIVAAALTHNFRAVELVEQEALEKLRGRGIENPTDEQLRGEVQRLAAERGLLL